MTPCTCLVQEGQISDAQQAALRAGMTEFAKRSFGSEPQINWITVPKGSGFTEAKPSTSVLVMMTADRSLPPSEREPLLRELCDIWMDGTGKSMNEVVTVVNDPRA